MLGRCKSYLMGRIFELSIRPHRMLKKASTNKIMFLYSFFLKFKQLMFMFFFIYRNFLPTDMKNILQEQQNTHDTKPASLISHESQIVQPNFAIETPIPDSGSISVFSNGSRKVSRGDIEFVQNSIERCLQLYMNRDVVVKTLQNHAGIDPRFTTLVWQKLEEENADFFQAYHIRLILKKQIIIFNQLLEIQYHVMKYPVPQKVPFTSMKDEVHPKAVNNLPMGYPIMQQPPIPATGQLHVDPMGYSTLSCHIVNRVPAPSNCHVMRTNSGNDMAIDNYTAALSPKMPHDAMSSISDIPMSPTSVASSGHLPFIPSEASGIAVDSSALDIAFTSDVASSVGLQLQPDNGAGNYGDSFRSLAQIPWNFSLSDLTAELSNLGDLGVLGNYHSSPFLPSDSDILLGSPEPTNTVNEFFVDSGSVPTQFPSWNEEES